MHSRALRLILAVHLIVLGGGYAIGPDQWSSGRTFTVIRELGVPVPAWGTVFVLAGVLLVLRFHTAGHAIALAALVFWGGGLAATLITGDLSGWGAPVHNLVLAAPLHALGLWRRSRVRVRGGARDQLRHQRHHGHRDQPAGRPDDGGDQ